MKYLKFILPLFIILFACSTDADDTLADTRLELTILDESNAALENVEVKLYASQEDYENDTNIIATSTTDVSGKATFGNLQPIIYFWRATIDCYLENAIHSTINPIVDNTLNLFSTNLTSAFMGEITIINPTNYNYTITFTGPENGNLNALSNENYIFTNLPTGTYTFNITPESGPNANYTQTEILECGENFLLIIN